ncbi:helix-hairpin-helix domain-containing protein [Gemmatimonadota bacterium]
MEDRRLIDLRSVGPATVRDLHALGIMSVQELAAQDGSDLFKRLCDLTGAYVDMCVLDVFNCAIAQARNPDLPAELCDWWTWSRIRKGEIEAP